MFQIVIQGDTNDADYIEAKINVERLDDVLFQENELFKGSHQVRYFMFCELFAKACLMSIGQPEHRRSNWSHEHSRSDKPREFTILTFAKMIGFDESQNNHEDLISVYEEVSDMIPYGDYGVHTIVSITATPVGQITKYL